MTAFYNEFDKTAAHVLREISKANLIVPGRVDDRSIKELTFNDFADAKQIHLFAGGGLWSVAARLAGWPDERPIWSASCPCQPFSQAGQGRGFDDERHLWPDVDRLIGEAIAAGRKPPCIVGEQVAGKAGYDWFNRVRLDLEAKGYWARVVDIPACAVDAPNIRQRLYWVAVANAECTGQQGQLREFGSVAAPSEQRPPDQSQRRDGANGGVGDAFDTGLEGQRRHGDREAGRAQQDRPIAEADGRNGSFWSDHEWIICHDSKARRAKPSIRLLVDGMAGRVHLWRIAGNAINAQLATEVLKALIDVT